MLGDARLVNRVAVVIGGTTGIGLAIACGLAEKGACVIPTSRKRENVEKAAHELKGFGPVPIVLQTDVRNLDDLERLRDRILAEHGRIDILVNSAGVGIKKAALDVKEEDWDLHLDSNLKGMFFACQVMGRTMIERGYGRILNIASMESFIVEKDAAPYCASKGGVAQLTKALAVEWAKHNVTVNAIAPGFILTPLNAETMKDGNAFYEGIIQRTPMGRIGRPEEIVGGALLLCSEAASFITGAVLMIDGGYAITVG